MACLQGLSFSLVLSVENGVTKCEGSMRIELIELLNYMNGGIPRSFYASRLSRIKDGGVSIGLHNAAIRCHRQRYGEEHFGTPP
jgi:hypothetical protein